MIRRFLTAIEAKECFWCETERKTGTHREPCPCPCHEARALAQDLVEQILRMAEKCDGRQLYFKRGVATKAGDFVPAQEWMTDLVAAALQGHDGGEPRADGDGTARLCQALYGRPAQPRDYLGGSDARMLHEAADKIAALQEPRGQQAGIWPSVCEGCFYSAWVPVETEQECAFVHPHQGEHVRCDYCWLKDQLAGSPAPAAAPTPDCICAPLGYQGHRPDCERYAAADRPATTPSACRCNDVPHDSFRSPWCPQHSRG